MSTDDFWAYVNDMVTHLHERSYYRLLGVLDGADRDTIASAYYTLVRRLHPDRHVRESEERKTALTRLYARVSEAYRVLSAADKRELYDRMLSRGHVRLTRALEAAEKSRARTPDPRTPKARALYERGQKLLTSGDARGARAQWQLAIQFEPDSRVLRQALDELSGKAAGNASPDRNAGGDMPSPKRASPERASPKRASPKRASPKRASPERASPERASPEREPVAAGLLALDEGRLVEACAQLASALQTDPRDHKLRALWYAALARFAQYEGRTQEAALHRQTALAFDPSCEAARTSK